jgi:hypothetical protein
MKVKKPLNSTDEVQALYEEAASILSNLEQAFSSIHLHPMLTNSPIIEGSVVNLLPALAATIWRHRSRSTRFLRLSSGSNPHLLQ